MTTTETYLMVQVLVGDSRDQTQEWFDNESFKLTQRKTANKRVAEFPDTTRLVKRTVVTTDEVLTAQVCVCGAREFSGCFCVGLSLKDFLASPGERRA